MSTEATTLERLNDDADDSAPSSAPPPQHGSIKSGRLAGLSMWTAIWVLAWPILIESMLNVSVGLVDTMLSAGISEAATDAIGVGSYIIWFLGMVAMAIGVGSTALIARSMGAGKVAVANAAVGQSVILAGIVGVLVGGLLALVAAPVASLMHMDEAAGPLFVEYTHILALAVPVIAIGMVGAACLRGAGDSKRPLVMMASVNVVNIVVSWALSGVDIAARSVSETGEVGRRILIENPFSFDMGIKGIAMGTLVAWTTGAMIVLVVLCRGRSGVRLLRHRLRLHASTMRRLLKVAIPNFIESVGMWTGNLITLLFVGWMGVAGLFGTHIVAIRVEAISFTPGFAMGLASATLAGQYLGAGDAAQAKLAVRRCAMISSVIMGLFGVAFILIPEQIVGLLTQQPTHLEYAPRLIFICGWIQVPFAIGMTIRNGLRGAGDTKFVAYITWVSTYAIRLPLAWLLCGVDIPLGSYGSIPNPNPYEWGIIGLWVGLCAEHVFRASMFTIRYLHGGWTRLRV